MGSCFDILGVTAACRVMNWKSKSSLGNKSPRINRHLDTGSGTPVERGAMYITGIGPGTGELSGTEVKSFFFLISFPPEKGGRERSQLMSQEKRREICLFSELR